MSPYIKQADRRRCNNVFDCKTAGELNFHITVDILNYLYRDCINQYDYTRCNEIIGVLDNVKEEFRRRVLIPYENEKKEENGDVY